MEATESFLAPLLARLDDSRIVDDLLRTYDEVRLDVGKRLGIELTAADDVVRERLRAELAAFLVFLALQDADEASRGPASTALDATLGSGAGARLDAYFATHEDEITVFKRFGRAIARTLDANAYRLLEPIGLAYWEPLHEVAGRAP